MLNKIKLSRCCAVLMYDILIYVLKAWTQTQASSLAYYGGAGRGWTGSGGEGCSVGLV